MWRISKMCRIFNATKLNLLMNKKGNSITKKERLKWAVG